MKIISYSYNLSQRLIPNTKLGNLGDGIQTLAVLEFFKQKNIEFSGFVDRNNLVNDMFINGWHRYVDQKLPKKAIYCSLHSDKNHLSNVDKNIHIGCRDPWTHQICKSIGLKSNVTGCVTINFPLCDTSTNTDILYIDSIHKQKNNIYTQFIDENTSWNDHMMFAKNRLDLISKASLVHTTRLHILIPCIAMGIPVCLDKVPQGKERFSHILKFITTNKVIDLNTGIREELLEIWKKNTTFLDEILINLNQTKV